MSSPPPTPPSSSSTLSSSSSAPSPTLSTIKSHLTALTQQPITRRTILLSSIATFLTSVVLGVAVAGVIERRRRRRDRKQRESGSADDSSSARSQFLTACHSRTLSIQSDSSKQPTIHNDNIIYRTPTEKDIDQIAQQWYDSYNQSAIALGGTALFPTVESAKALVSAYVLSTKFGLLAVDSKSGELIASGFHDEDDVQRGSVSVGPYTVTYSLLNHGHGRFLFQRMIHYSLARGATSFRLLHGTSNHAAYNCYVGMGFSVKESLVFMKGMISAELIDEVLNGEEAKKNGADDWTVSEWTEHDVASISAFWEHCTSQSRQGTLSTIGKAKRKFKRMVVRDGKGEVVLVVQRTTRVAFTTGFGSMGSSCATSAFAFKFLLCSYARLQSQATDETRTFPMMFHFCTRLYPELYRWLLGKARMKIARTACLMVLGEWQEIETDKFIYCPSTELC